ncbi:MAG TPA: DUF1294 domain-containing protein [Flavobacterium sp.]|nr:DUF1294 domain-containing protein [Flavobacterium sp.]
MSIIYSYFLIVSLVSFILFGYDKYLARNHKRRIPESTLLAWSYIGGSVGAGIGMWVFKHKTSKRSFLWKLYGVILFQFLIGLALYYSKVIRVY